jgi:hypothetical protein
VLFQLSYCGLLQSMIPKSEYGFRKRSCFRKILAP